MGYTVLAVGLVLIVAAWACYQYPNLINPYGNMSPERKALVDIEGLKKAFAIISGVTGFLLVVNAALYMLKVIDEDVCGIVLMVLTFAMMVPLFIAMRRYNGFGRDRSGQLKQSDTTSKPWLRTASRVSWISTGIVMVLLAIVLALSMRSQRITVGEENVKISGLYGREIPFADIVSVELLDEMPAIRQRVNGSDTGRRLKGHFLLKNGEKCMIFIRKQAPYIELRTSDKLYYFNVDSQEETSQLYQEINARKP